jgi:polar amino acid transport system permease protein
VEALNAVLVGVPLTLLVTAAAFAMGAVLGVPLVVGLRSERALARIPCRFLVDLLRGVPAIVWLFVIYFGVSIGAYRFAAVPAAIIGLGAISAAYLAEIYRGGISSVHAGQWEAAQALGVDGRTVFSRIVGPQALRVSIPSMASYLISLLKDSSIASTIGVTEIVFYTTQDARSGGGGLTVYIIAAITYTVLSIPLGLASRALYDSLRKKVSR